MSTKMKKKKPSSSKSSPSGQPNDANPQITTPSQSFSNVGKPRTVLWPEWSDADVNQEKWGASRESKDKKRKLTFFEDLDGRFPLPPNLKVSSWKRPSEFIIDKEPVVVENQSNFDLVTNNPHLNHCELIRSIVADIYIVWLSSNSSTAHDEWKPWEHIYALSKAEKGHIPLYNNFGKYIIRLYWMGCWRKITIDDSMPFDEDNNLLLPCSSYPFELWPMLLTKALLKVACSNGVTEVGRTAGEFTFIQVLTGWIPEVLSLKDTRANRIWESLQEDVPKFVYQEESMLNFNSSSSEQGTVIDFFENQKDSFLSDLHVGFQDTSKIVCASFYPCLQASDPFGFGNMADSSRYLRRYGLSLLRNHGVLLTRTRMCPLQSPPKPPPLPRWKLIRPQRTASISSEPKMHWEPKIDQFIEVIFPSFTGLVDSSSDSPQESKRIFIDNDNLLMQLRVTWENGLTKGLHAPSLSSISEEHDDDSVASPVQAVTEITLSSQVQIDKPEGSTKDKRKDAEESVDAIMKNILQRVWVDLDDFVKCFQTLLIFHKLEIYGHHSQKSSYKSSILHSLSSNVSVGTTGAPNSGVPEHVEVKGSYFLCVDGKQPSKILVSFSSLPSGDEKTERKKKRFGSPRSAALIIQPYSWKTLDSHLPILIIKTTYCRGAVLRLPAGRHVMQVYANAPLGYNVLLFSETPFIFDDEDSVMSQLTSNEKDSSSSCLCFRNSFVNAISPKKESSRFTKRAISNFEVLTDVVRCLGNESELYEARRAMKEAISPMHIINPSKKWEFQTVFTLAVLQMLVTVLDRALTPEERFAVQFLTSWYFPRSRQQTSLIAGNKKRQIPKNWKNREPTLEEVHACILVQSVFRGHLVRLFFNTSKPGTKENLSVTNVLNEIWPKAEEDVEMHASFLLRYIFENFKSNVEYYPSLQDELTRIVFDDYPAPIPKISNSWVLIFRQVFFIPKEMLIVPKVFSPISNWLLHVINNDTGEEIETIFYKVVPNVYKPNKNGYTFLAEVITPKGNFGGGEWRLRLTSLKQPLPKVNNKNQPNVFTVKEFQDYYIPNENNLICRYCIEANSEVLGTVQFETSWRDVQIQLSILDMDKEVSENTGQGHVIIPAFYFQPKEEPLDVESEEADPTQETAQRHNYMVQVKLLNNSWELDRSQLAFALMHKRTIDKETIVFKPEDFKPTPGFDTTSQDSQKPDTPKSHHKIKPQKMESKMKMTKSEEPPPTSNSTFDYTKPHWTLRIVVDKIKAGDIEVKKDTKRIDQIKLIKMSWETAEPGRSARAYNARMSYLKKIDPEAGDEFSPEDIKDSDVSQSIEKLSGLTSFNPNVEFEHLVRRTKEVPELMNEEIEEAKQRESLEMMRVYQAGRNEKLKKYEQLQSERKEMIKYHMEIAENMKVNTRKITSTLCSLVKAFDDNQKKKPEDRNQNSRQTITETEKSPPSQQGKSSKRKKK